MVPYTLYRRALRKHERNARYAHDAGAEGAEVQHPLMPGNVNDADQENSNRALAGGNCKDVHCLADDFVFYCSCKLVGV